MPVSHVRDPVRLQDASPGVQIPTSWWHISLEATGDSLHNQISPRVGFPSAGISLPQPAPALAAAGILVVQQQVEGLSLSFFSVFASQINK